jgi:hypothetical protein
VNLCFNDCPDFLMMTNFLPLFTSINSIEICGDNSAVLGQLQSEYSDESKLAIPLLTSARILLAELVY